MRPAKGHEINRHGMVDETQETYQHTRGIEEESVHQCPWRTTRTWHALLGHLCPGGNLADGPPVYDPLITEV